MPPVSIAAAVLIVTNVVLIALVLARGWWVERQRRRHDALMSRLRRPAVELIDGDTAPTALELSHSESEAFAELLAQYGNRLRGESRQRIVDYFERSGALDGEIRRLDSRRAWHRASAAFTLGDIGSARAVPALVARLDDPSRDVRGAATRSLGHLSALGAIEPIVTAGVGGRVPGGISNLALLDIGPQAIDRVTPLLEHDDASVRASAVRLIGLLGGVSEVDQLLDHMTDPAAPVRSATACALGLLGAGNARDALIRALEDRVPAVRTAAAEALGNIGGRQAIAALIPVAQAPDFDAARAAAEALRRIDGSVVVELAGAPDAGPHICEAADRARL